MDDQKYASKVLTELKDMGSLSFILIQIDT